MRCCSPNDGILISSLARSFGDNDNSVVAPRRSTSILGRKTSLDRIANSAPPVAVGPGRTTMTLPLAMAPAVSLPTRPNFSNVPRPVTRTSSARTAYVSARAAGEPTSPSASRAVTSPS